MQGAKLKAKQFSDETTINEELFKILEAISLPIKVDA